MRSYVYAALFTVMILLAQRAEAYCTACKYCGFTPCTCFSCELTGDGSCMYCNFFGCNCEGCPNYPACGFASKDKTKPDTNDDAEANKTARKRFEEMDRNHDHAVSLAELTRWVKRHPKFMRGYADGVSPETLMKRADTNGDGSISPAEAGFE